MSNLKPCLLQDICELSQVEFDDAEKCPLRAPDPRVEELERMKRDYELFEEMAPPDVPRAEFAKWCYDAWDKSHEPDPRVERLAEAVRKALRVTASEGDRVELMDALEEMEKGEKS